MIPGRLSLENKLNAKSAKLRKDCALSSEFLQLAYLPATSLPRASRVRSSKRRLIISFYMDEYSQIKNRIRFRVNTRNAFSTQLRLAFFLFFLRKKQMKYEMQTVTQLYPKYHSVNIADSSARALPITPLPRAARARASERRLIIPLLVRRTWESP